MIINKINDITIIEFDKFNNVDDFEYTKLMIIKLESIILMVETENISKLILDFKKVTYLTSTMLSKIFTINNQIKNNSGIMSITNLEPYLKRVFDMTGAWHFTNYSPSIESSIDFINLNIS